MCVAVCCSVLRCVAVCCRTHSIDKLRSAAPKEDLYDYAAMCAAVCYSLPQCAPVCDSVLQRVMQCVVAGYRVV